MFHIQAPPAPALTPKKLAPGASATRAPEESETHTAIDKEDMEKHRRGQRALDDNYKPVDIYEDLSEVSIALLRGFLQGLIETKERVLAEKQRAPSAPYAMQAYQSAMKTAPDAPPPPTVAGDAEVSGFTRLDLAAENLDRGAITDIMGDLEKLEQAGVMFITIEQSTSFLQSIRDGIARVVAT